MTPSDRALLGARLKAAREARAWTQADLADRIAEALGGSQIPDRDTLISYVKRWEAGRTNVSARYRRAYADALGVMVGDLFDGPDSSPAHPVLPHDAEDDVKRRELLQLGMLGVVTHTHNDLIRYSLDQVLAAAETNLVEDWHLTYLDHAHNILVSPPADVHRALLLDLAALHQQISRHGLDRDLLRVAAQLAVLSGNALTRMGSYEDARRWWATARHAADASGDGNLSAWTRGKEAAFALYAPRPLSVVMALTDTARRKAGRPCPGLLCALGAQAQGLATMGRASEAQRVLEELTDVQDRTDDHGGYEWTEDATAYVTSWVHAHGGREEKGAAARAEVVRISRSYQNIANARLHEAIAVARHGGHVEAARTAADVIAGMEPSFRTRMIVHTAHRVLEATPIRFRQETAVRDLEDVLSATAP